MKKLKKQLVLLLFTAVIFITAGFAGCKGLPEGNGGDGGDETPKTYCTVSLSQSADKFTVISNNPLTVEKNGTAEFKLKMNGDYCAEKILRQGQVLSAEIIYGYDSVTTIRIPDIKFSIKADVQCIVSNVRIAYHPNGGSYIGGDNSDKPYTVGYVLKSRLRPNTEIGTNHIARTGYVLTGWNTKADGTGERIGLGSRVTVYQNGIIDLYAMWSKTTDVKDFTFENSGGQIAVKKYKGNADCVTIPELYDGKEVTSIAAGAFSGDIYTVILPHTMRRIEKSAFVDCGIEELYFYDNLTTISDDSFSNCANFSTVHINAIQPPRFGPGTLASEINLADKYDILMLNAEKKKVIVLGGSGAYFSVDTLQMEDELDTDALGDGYVCINMAVNGWFNGPAQFDMIMPFLREDDIFIYAPESSAAMLMFYNIQMMPVYNTFTYNRIRFFSCLESNYDLVGLIDKRNVEELLDCYAAFNEERKNMTAVSYTDFLTEISLYGAKYKNDTGYIDKRGNFALPKIPRGGNLDKGEADIVPEYVTDATANSRINAYFDKIVGLTGSEVFFTTAPVNKDTLYTRLNNPEDLEWDNGVLLYKRPYPIPITSPDFETWISDFERAVRSNYRCEVLLPLSDTMYITEDFFDADYHLSDSMTPDYTGKIIKALNAALGR